MVRRHTWLGGIRLCGNSSVAGHARGGNPTFLRPRLEASLSGQNAPFAVGRAARPCHKQSIQYGGHSFAKTASRIPSFWIGLQDCPRHYISALRSRCAQLVLPCRCPGGCLEIKVPHIFVAQYIADEYHDDYINPFYSLNVALVSFSRLTAFFSTYF